MCEGMLGFLEFSSFISNIQSSIKSYGLFRGFILKKKLQSLTLKLTTIKA